jgi:hypothetical protein
MAKENAAVQCRSASGIRPVRRARSMVTNGNASRAA